MTGALVPLEIGVSGKQLDLELDLQLAPGSLLRLGVLGSTDGCTSASPNEETIIELRRATDGTNNGALRLDRTRSSLDPTVDVEDKSGPVPMPEGRVHLRVILDRSAVEIFANGVPLTARVTPPWAGNTSALPPKARHRYSPSTHGPWPESMRVPGASSPERGEAQSDLGR